MKMKMLRWGKEKDQKWANLDQKEVEIKDNSIWQIQNRMRNIINQRSFRIIFYHYNFINRSNLQFYFLIHLFNKIMSLLPLINRPFNINFFANPLNGLLYSGQSIQNKSLKKQEYSTISYHTSQRKMKFSTINNSKNKSIHKFKQQNIDQSLQVKPLQAVKTEKIKKYNFDTVLSDNSQIQSSLKISSRVSKRPTEYMYPQVQIIPLHLIKSYQDIAKCHFYISLQMYFKLFFPVQFKHNSQKLIQHLDKFMPKLKHYKILDLQVDKTKWPQKFWEIKTISEFLEISESYDKNSQYWVKYILVLINQYFVPHKSVRQNSLQNLQILIHKKIKQKLLIQKSDQKFVFMTENRLIVQDFVDIPFNATKLYFTKRQSPEKLYQKFKNYQQMIQQYKIDFKNKGFINRLKNHFRKQIVPDKYSEQTINYERNVNSKDKQRKKCILKAKDLLQQKNSSRLKFHKVLSNHYSKIKLKQQSWMQENVQNTFSRLQKTDQIYEFHIYFKDKKQQNQIIDQFETFRTKSLKINTNLKQNQILIRCILQDNEVLQEMAKTPFHSRKIKMIFQTLLNTSLNDDWNIKQIIQWSKFLEFSILASNNLQKLIKNTDCNQLVRNFVQEFLKMKQDDYFRDQLTAKLFEIIQGNNENLLMMEEVLWNWLSQNNFVRLGAIQRSLLWTFEQRSKRFYLLIISLLFGTYKTTLLDLAYELLV